MRSPTVWAFRVTWVALAFTEAPAIGQALDGRTRSVQVAATTGAWVVWAFVLLAALVPTTVSLTVVRALVPGAAAIAVVAWAAGSSNVAGPLAVGTAGLAAALAFSGDLGEAFAQGSAYGDERRLLLRPPGPLMLFVPLTWLVAATGLVVGVLALAARQWVIGPPLTAVGLALAWVLGPRYHRLSRRWLVLVPAGVVVHDHVVLAETAMLGRADVAGAALALADTEALNLTGMALGPAVEIRLRELTTVVLAAPPRGSTKAVHAQSLLVGPTRPGRALRALGAAGVPVG